MRNDVAFCSDVNVPVNNFCDNKSSKKSGEKRVKKSDKKSGTNPIKCLIKSLVHDYK